MILSDFMGLFGYGDLVKKLNFLTLLPISPI